MHALPARIRVHPVPLRRKSLRPTRLLGHALREAGNTACEQHEVPGMDHGSILDAAYAYLLKFIRQRLAPAS